MESNDVLLDLARAYIAKLEEYLEHVDAIADAWPDLSSADRRDARDIVRKLTDATNDVAILFADRGLHGEEERVWDLDEQLRQALPMV